MPDSQPSASSKTRVDNAHGFEPKAWEFGPAKLEDQSPEVEASEVLSAIAGTDPQASASQMRGQAMELSAYLQEKQSLLDRRESEMNARLAVLENEARIARLRQDIGDAETDPRTEPIGPSPSNTESTAEINDSSLDCGIDLDRPSRDRGVENNSVEVEFQPLTNRDPYEPKRAIPEEEHTLRAEFAKIRTSTPHSTPVPNDSAGSASEMHETLCQQKAVLEKREQQLQDLHDQITELHRESLELRVATEHVWTDFRGHMPDEELAQSLAQHRSRLADHYKLANDELCRRRQILHQLQQHLSQQEEELRRERLDMQMWVDRQRNDVEAKSANMAAREYEFERREAELQRQAIMWQKQREDYRHEIERLSQRLRYAGSA